MSKTEQPTVVEINTSFTLGEKKASFLKQDETGKYAEVFSSNKSETVLHLDDGVSVTVNTPDFFDKDVVELKKGVKLYFSPENILIKASVLPAPTKAEAKTGRSSGCMERTSASVFDR